MFTCECGGKVIYDADNCGHEWLDCQKCGRSLETYQSDSIKNEWLGIKPVKKVFKVIHL